ETCKLLCDQVEALHRAAIIVLVVADDEFLGHALDAPWIAPEWLHGIGCWHRLSPLKRLLDHHPARLKQRECDEANHARNPKEQGIAHLPAEQARERGDADQRSQPAAKGHACEQT